jgi:hypothetical protein
MLNERRMNVNKKKKRERIDEEIGYEHKNEEYPTSGELWALSGFTLEIPEG